MSIIYHCAILFNIPGLHVFHIGKRLDKFAHWEPFYVGTHAEPHYDERMTWEGRKNKMIQVNCYCIFDQFFRYSLILYTTFY